MSASRQARAIRTRVVRVRAFAKINLTLQVVAFRPDGYHDLRTTFQSVALHDTLTITRRRGPFQIDADDPGCPIDATNLVWRAAEALWRADGRRDPVADVHVRIRKRIPVGGGLGGGSCPINPPGNPSFASLQNPLEIYLNIAACPTDAPEPMPGQQPLSYVVNAGQPDALPTAATAARWFGCASTTTARASRRKTCRGCSSAASAQNRDPRARDCTGARSPPRRSAAK